MRILVVTQYFPPDMGAPAGRFFDFAKHWTAQGFEVVVVTGMPHFPGGTIHEGYRSRVFLREERAGAEVHRCWTFTSKRRGFGRGLAYATFLLSSSLYLLFGRLRYDVVIGTSPPPSVGLPALLGAWRRRVPFVLDIRDIWPEAIVQSGRLTNPLLIRVFEGLVRFLYRRATRISAVTEGGRLRLIEMGVPGEKVAVLPNGVDVAAFDRDAAGALPEAFAALEADANWFVYAGILNSPQGLEIILEAAALMRERQPAFYACSQFVIVGEGPREADLRESARKQGLDRVVFVPRQDRSAVFALLRQSYAVLVTLRPRKDISTVPSKLYESMASGRPVLYSAAGEGAATLERAGGGIVCEPGNAEALEAAMTELLRDPEAAKRGGEAARRFVAQHYDRAQIAADFVAVLEQACHPEPEAH